MAANITTNLIARTAVFDRNIKRSHNTLVMFSGGAARVGSALKTMFVATIGAAGITGLGYLLKRTMDDIDATAKLADRIGETTENLIALSHAAKIAGSNQDTLTKSLDILVRRVGEVKMGVGQAKLALNSLGISVKDLDKLSPAEMFETISKRIMEIPSATDRATAAYSLMGRKGTELLNLMDDLSKKGMDGLLKDADRLGILFSRLDAARVEQAADAMTRINIVMRGALQTAVIELSDYIVIAADRITEMGTEGRSLGEILVDSFAGAAKMATYFAQKLWEVKQELLAVDIVIADFALDDSIAESLGDAYISAISPYERIDNLVKQIEQSRADLQAELEKRRFGGGSDEEMEFEPKKLSSLYVWRPEDDWLNESKIAVEMERQLILAEKMHELQIDSAELAEYRMLLERRYADDTELLEARWEHILDVYKRIEELGDKEKKKENEMDAGEGMEIDTSLISVQGLAIGGFNPLVAAIDKGTEYARRTAENTAKIANKTTEGGLM